MLELAGYRMYRRSDISDIPPADGAAVNVADLPQNRPFHRAPFGLYAGGSSNLKKAALAGDTFLPLAVYFFLHAEFCLRAPT